MSGRRVCFLSFTHPSFDTRILHKEARSLAAAGFDVSHVAPAQPGESGRVENGVRVEVYRRWPGGRLTRFFQLYGIALRQHADCYHCNEVESWLVGMALKLLHPRRRVVFDVHEHYPSRFYEPHFPRWIGRPGERVVRFLFRWLGPRTDHLVFAKRSVMPDFRPDPSRQTLIFNYAPLRFQGRRREDVPLEIRREFEGRPTAIHIGDLSRARGWPQLLQALSVMKHREMRALCLGGVAEGEAALMDEARRLGVADRIEVRARVPYEQVFHYLLCADVGLMLYQPGILNHTYAFPMKLYDYMMAALPVIGPDFSVEVVPVIREESCGWALDTSDPGALAEALDLVCERPDEAREAGASGRRAVLRRYNWEVEAEKLVRIYEGLLRSSRSAAPSHTPASV